MNKIAEENILVIAGGTGMGKAVAIKLSQEGFNVAISGRRSEKLRDIVDKSALKIKSNTVDVVDRISVAQLFTWFEKNIGKLDILINAAGINTANRTIENLDPNQWDNLVQRNM